MENYDKHTPITFDIYAIDRHDTDIVVPVLGYNVQDERVLVDIGNDYVEYPLNLYYITLYTGLKDANGNKLFEGDIIEIQFGDGHNIPMVVEKGKGTWILVPQVDKSEHQKIEMDLAHILSYNPVKRIGSVGGF